MHRQGILEEEGVLGHAGKCRGSMREHINFPQTLPELMSLSY